MKKAVNVVQITSRLNTFNIFLKINRTEDVKNDGENLTTVRMKVSDRTRFPQVPARARKERHSRRSSGGLLILCYPAVSRTTGRTDSKSPG